MVEDACFDGRSSGAGHKKKNAALLRGGIHGWHAKRRQSFLQLLQQQPPRHL